MEGSKLWGEILTAEQFLFATKNFVNSEDFGKRWRHHYWGEGKQEEEENFGTFIKILVFLIEELSCGENRVKTFWRYPETKNTTRNTGKTRIDTTSGPKYKKKYRKDKDRYNFWTKIQQEIQVRQGKIQLLEQNTRINTGKTGENTASWTSLVIEWRHQRSAQRQHRTSRARVELLYMIIILIININHQSIYHYHKFVATADRVWLCDFFQKTARFLE